MNRTSVYEFPLNERIRMFMRLENSFAQLAHFSGRNHIWDSQASLLILLDVLGIMDRFDIKNEISKELERNIAILSTLLDTPAVNTYTLQQTLTDLNKHLALIQNINGKLSSNLRDDDLLTTLRQRAAIANGINNFEIPSYYYWMNQANDRRQQQLDQWLNESIPIADSISLLLDLIRGSADFAEQTAEGGYFQKALSTQQLCQMLRIVLPAEVNYFPETSGNKHMVSVRFLTYPTTKQRPIQVTDNVAFDISYCGI